MSLCGLSSYDVVKRGLLSVVTIASKSGLKANNQLDPIVFNQLIDADISKPARYLGHELGVQAKNWESSKVHWALTYPDLYEIGVSNLGHLILYSILNTVPDQMCDRAYLPAPDMAKRLRDASQKLFALESRRPLIAFDIVGFSLSYELGATNVLEMLDLSEIPLYSIKRTDLPINHPESPPLVFAGGPTATSNPEPYADFFDFFALGDGEELLPEIGLVVSEAKENNLSRSELLKDLSEIPGVYIPALYEKKGTEISIKPKFESIPKKILRRVATPIPFYATSLVPNIETVHDRLTVEIRRGCTRGCRFCQPGMLTRPARDVEPEEIINAVEDGMQKTGYSDFSLLSLSCSDYLSLPAVGVELRNRLAKQNISLQLPSQRIDRFDDNIAHILGGSRKAGLTFAPEAGTQRLRNIVNKGLTDADLIKGIRKAMENGFRKVKLYFMIGLPGERDEDVEGIAETCKMLQSKCSDLGRLNLNLTISNFTPKPHTPFQWHSVSRNELERKQKLLKTSLKQLKGIKANFTDLRLSAMEDFIGRGDRQIAPVIEKAWRLGAGMDAWFESLDRAFDAWTQAIDSAGLAGKYRKLEIGSWNDIEALKTSDLNVLDKQPLPWDHIDTGLEKKWLANDLQKALKEIVVEDCSFDSCSKCGVCGPELGHNLIAKPPEIPKQKPTENPPSQRVCRVRFRFSKTNPMHLISHLDVMRIFERAFRRSHLPVSYSAGFHPLPRFQLALALPLGIEANGELMDIDFYEIVEGESIRKKLQETLPKGLNLIEAKVIPITKKGLSQEIAGSIWTFSLQARTESKKSLHDWGKAIASLLETKEIIWHDKDKKGRPRTRNCRPCLGSLKLKTTSVSSSPETQVQRVGLELNTKIDDLGRSIKPIQIKCWLEEYFDQSLIIDDVKRDEIKLLQC